MPAFNKTAANTNQFRNSTDKDIERDGRPILFIDLDATMVHVTKLYPGIIVDVPKTDDFFVFSTISGDAFAAQLRPGVKVFLEKLATRYILSVYTKSLKNYALCIMRALDPGDRHCQVRF